jgi:hypothetical protein
LTKVTDVEVPKHLSGRSPGAVVVQTELKDNWSDEKKMRVIKSLNELENSR